MRVEEVDACDFVKWFPKFKRHHFPATIIELGQGFLDYLQQDGIFLPKCGNARYVTGDAEGSDTEEWKNRSEDESEQMDIEAPEFILLEEKIKETIEKYNYVFPKLNWSAPKDATWLVPNNELKCTHPADLFLLLKGSTFVHHDIDNAYQFCSDRETVENSPKRKMHLVLKKYYNINSSNEFRCFVRGRKLIGVCARDETSYFPHISENIADYTRLVHSFHLENVARIFPIQDYVMDVYIQKNTVYIIDFNTFGGSTEPLLFSYVDELNNHDFPNDNAKYLDLDPSLRVYRFGDDVVGVKIIDNETSVQPSPMQYTRLPIDTVDLMSGNDIDKFVDLCRQNKFQNRSGNGEECNEADSENQVSDMEIIEKILGNNCN